MKKLFLKRAAQLLLVALILSGCTKTNTETDKSRAITAKATTVNEPDTRMGYQENVNWMNFTWEDNAGNKEKFSVFEKRAILSTIFTQTDTGGTNSGTFSGTFNTPPTSGTIFYAVYPVVATPPRFPTEVPFSLRTQKFATTADALKHNPYHYMWATATYTDNNQINFDFKHKVSILKAEMTLPTGTAAIKTVRLSGIYADAELNLNNGFMNVYNYNSSLNESMMTDVSGVALVNNKITVYFYVFPQDRTDKKLKLKVVDANNKLYEVEFNGRKIEEGKVYSLAQTLHPVTELRLGDFYMNDKTWITREVSSLTDAQKANCRGIVFFINPDGVSGKLVGADEPVGKKLTWGPNGNILSTNDITGMSNMYTMGSIIGRMQLYPVFKWVDSKNAPRTDYSVPCAKGIWYIPSIKELRQLFAGAADLKWVSLAQSACQPGEVIDWGLGTSMPNETYTRGLRVIFNDLFTTLGKPRTSEFYWSSTQSTDTKAFGMMPLHGLSKAMDMNTEQSVCFISIF